MEMRMSRAKGQCMTVINPLDFHIKFIVNVLFKWGFSVFSLRVFPLNQKLGLLFHSKCSVSGYE